MELCKECGCLECECKKENKIRYAIVNSRPANGRFEFGVWHETKELAIEEAKRLCSCNPSKEFIVVQEIGIAKTQETPIIFKEI